MPPGCELARLRPRTKGEFKGTLGGVFGLEAAYFPLPLWEKVAREAKTDEGSLSAETDPSSGADFVRATFSHKGRRKNYAAAFGKR